MSELTRKSKKNKKQAKSAATKSSQAAKVNFPATMGKLIGYSRRYLPAIIIALIGATGGAILQIVGPNELSRLTDEVMVGLPTMVQGETIVKSINMTAVGNIGLTLAVLYGISFVLRYAQGLIMATVTQIISKRMRSDISNKVNRLPLKYFDSTSIGDVLSRVTNDVDAIGQTLNQSVGTLITALTTLVGSLVMMFYNSWILTLTALAASSIGFLLMFVIMHGSQRHFKRQQDELGEINGYIEEVYSGHNVVKVYNGSKEAKKTFEASNASLYDSVWKAQFLSGLMMPIMSFVGNFGYVAVCVVGAVLAMEGTITFGVVVAFMMYIRLFTQPLSQIAQAMNNLQRTAAASDRVFEFLGEPELENESDKTTRLEQVSGEVLFKNVKFGYAPEKPVIKNFSAQVKAGQKVAIVGPTGAGKTTMINLLMRFYDVDSGEIHIDGVPIHEVPREDVHTQFSMVLQDTWLFEGTIRDNIVYNKDHVSDEEVIRAGKTVGLDHFIDTLPNGYNTVLDDKTSLSEGQKQLITIARAMVQNAPLLILDEATSSVDTRTEKIVQAAMDKLTKGRTSFVIAHRLSTIKNADLILVMKDGDIIENGSHEELLQQEGFYADLYNSQFALA